MGYYSYDPELIYGWCPGFAVRLLDVNNICEYAGSVTKDAVSEFYYGIAVTLGEDGKPIIPGDVKAKVQEQYRRVFPNASTEQVESTCSVYCVIEGDYDIDDWCEMYKVQEFQKMTTNN